MRLSGRIAGMSDRLPSQLLMISEVGRRSGASVAARRFYESVGLIASVRGPNNRRYFPRHVLRRLAFIAAAQRIGLSLGEIANALATLPSDRPPGPKEWSRLSEPWVERVDKAIVDLEVLRRSLVNCIGCGCLSMNDCELLNPDDEAAGEGAGSRWLRESIS
jgi:MerR family redox-sensitive transcriptional activator SoxR